MALADLLVLCSGLFQRFSDMCYQLSPEPIPLRSMGLHSTQLGSPCREGSTLKGTRSQSRGIADTQRADFLRFAIVVLLAEGG